MFLNLKCYVSLRKSKQGDFSLLGGWGTHHTQDMWPPSSSPRRRTETDANEGKGKGALLPANCQP